MDQTSHDLNTEQMQQARQGGLPPEQIDLLRGIKQATNRLPHEPKVKAACEAMADKGYKGPTSAAEDFSEVLDKLIEGQSLLELFPHFREC